ncbi:MAG: peptide chain release factor N(5)-glutamine methyltransferase [Novosphingobium sp.]
MTPGEGQTVAAAIRAATELLGARTDTARLDAELLMAHVLGVSRSDLFLWRMGDPAPAEFADLVARRAANEPVAHIVGHTDFWGLTFEVSEAVLVPRADSETLIEAAVQAFAGRAPRRIIDLGTGSGCLLLAALSEWPAAEGIGIDRSAEALAVATRNARRMDLQAEMIRADWTTPGWAGGLGRFDLVLANPPYVEEAAELEPTVRDHEPAGALFAGPEGLDAYRVLIPQLPGLLALGGIALVEIGYRQADAVGAIAADAGFDWTLHRDLGERPRALELKFSLGKPDASA